MLSVRTVSAPPSLPAFLPVSYPAALAWRPGVEELSSAREQVPGSTISLVQSLAGQTSLVAVGLGSLLPPTSPAVLHLADSLWTLLLPGGARASWDLWGLGQGGGGAGCREARGWLAQRLLWRLEGGGGAAVAPAWVEGGQGGEREEEQEELVESVLDIQLDCDSAASCMTQLYTELVEDDNFPCITGREVTLVEAWRKDLRAVNYSLPLVRKKKSFAYLTQGGRLTPTATPRLQGAAREDGRNYDTYYLSFLTPSGDLFFPNSTFQQGRNALLRLALARQLQPGYDYFIFTDEDVTLQVNDDPRARWKEDMAANAWQRFEEFLLHFRPKIGFGQYPSHRVADPNKPVSVTTSHDACMVAYHRYVKAHLHNYLNFSRSTLEFGQPLLESPLDLVSSWNQDCLHTWFLKLFFTNSAFQCNSVTTTNGGSRYHNVKTPGSDYVYRQGFHMQDVKEVIRQHINLTVAKNPLLTLLEKFDKNAMVHRSSWGQMLINPKVFQIANTTKFGFGFQQDIFRFFNVCASLFRAQWRWWKSGLCRYLKSTEVEAARSLVEETCSK